jgi:RimJ/RimL family protein N-acetyltransferase
MRLVIEDIVLRRPEERDLPKLYEFKNDPLVASALGGFSTGYSSCDMNAWLASHQGRKDEVLWTIADKNTDDCLGHVGLYCLDHRIRSAEYAIMIGEESARGRGLGKLVTLEVLSYGFKWLNLNRIELSVLSNNEAALRLYKAVGFVHEGTRRQAQYKDGVYLDLHVMGLLRSEYEKK